MDKSLSELPYRWGNSDFYHRIGGLRVPQSYSWCLDLDPGWGSNREFPVIEPACDRIPV